MSFPQREHGCDLHLGQRVDYCSSLIAPQHPCRLPAPHPLSSEMIITDPVFLFELYINQIVSIYFCCIISNTKYVDVIRLMLIAVYYLIFCYANKIQFV